MEVDMWEAMARKVQKEGRGNWDSLTRDEQAKLISYWVDEEGRIELLADSPADIIGMVAAMYACRPDDNKTAMAQIGDMVCAALALAAIRSIENFWKRNGEQ
jgi:hypothetical protein